MKNWLLSFGRAPALSLLSQGLGMVQLFLLLWHYGATGATDAYLYLFNLGNLPTQILITGFMYPSLLNGSRLSRKALRSFLGVVPTLALLLVLSASVGLLTESRIGESAFLFIFFCAINSVLQTVVWFFGTLSDFEGNPVWISGIALPGNFLACLALMLPLNSSVANVTAIFASLAVGNCLLLALMLKRRVGFEVIYSYSEFPASSSNFARNRPFLFRAISVYGGFMVIQSLTVSLPASVLTLLSVPMKIVASVTASFLNATLPKIINKDTQSPGSSITFLKYVLVAVVGFGLTAELLSFIFWPTYIAEVGVSAIWLTTSCLSAVSQRLSNRFRNPSSTNLVSAVVPVTAILVLASSSTAGFGALAILCAYGFADAVSSVIQFRVIEFRRFSLISSVLATGVGIVWVASLVG